MTSRQTDDEILRGVVGGGAARVVAVTTTGVALEAIRRHAATGASAVALARGLTSGLLLATLTKDDERVTLQVLGDGPLGGLTVDATSAGTARAYVRSVGVPLEEPPHVVGGEAARPRLARAVGAGLVNVVRDVGLGQPFHGHTSIDTGEIDEDCAHYLMASEQIDSALRCETILGPDGTLVAAAGILVQALPGGRGTGIVSGARAQLGDGALLKALTASGAAGGPTLDVGTLVEDALGDVLGAWHALDVRAVRFACPCSRARAGASLTLLGPTELGAMILEDGQAEVVCNFCRARHEFTAAELELLRRELDRPTGPPS